MKKITAAIALAGACAFGPSVAVAGPYTLYEFRITSFACTGWGGTQPNTECGGTYGRVSDLQGMRVGIGAGATTGQLTIKSMEDVPGDPVTFEYSNANIEYADFSRVGSVVDMANNVCLSAHICYLVSSFEINDLLQLLSGSFSLLNSSDGIQMSSGGSTLWTGYYGSDSIPQNRLSFTGIWYETPEPATLALFGLAGLGALASRRRRALA